jgi:hypothetical protein
MRCRALHATRVQHGKSRFVLFGEMQGASITLMVDHIIDVSESPQSPPNVFALATPQHLLMKLRWEIVSTPQSSRFRKGTPSGFSSCSRSHTTSE